jgi:hypothetical protein
MAFIDMTDTVVDPMLATTFTVKRRQETVNSKGRSVQTVKMIPGVVGVVTSAGRNDLERLPEEQRMGRNFVVVTNFKLRGPTTGYQPDVIVWLGSDCVIKQLDPYPQFGLGFMQAIIGSMENMDGAILTPAPYVGKVDYSDASQSGLIGAQ